MNRELRSLRYMTFYVLISKFNPLLFRCFALLQSYVPIARACVLIRPPAIVAKHDNTHVCKTSFPPRSDSNLGFHCKRAVAETFPERHSVIRASSRTGNWMNLQQIFLTRSKNISQTLNTRLKILHRFYPEKNFL